VIASFINRELQTQDAAKQGLDKTAEARQQLNQARQIASLGNTSALQQYKLPQEKSIDSSKTRGGDLGWMLSNQVSPAIAPLGKNISMTTPIQVESGWGIVKVEDRRCYKLPTFSQSQAAISNELL
jgi:parvulin-like peptidyl-prolyl isomerase